MWGNYQTILARQMGLGRGIGMGYWLCDFSKMGVDPFKTDHIHLILHFF